MADETSQQEFVSKFRAMPRERQTALIGKMSPEQKTKLSVAIKANPAGANPAATPPASSQGAPISGVYADVGKGFAKGAMETVNTVSKGLNKIPGVGETLAPSQGIKAVDQITPSTNAAQSVGKAGENIAEFAAAEGALKMLTTALKVKDLASAAKIIKQYPWLSNPWLSKVGVAGIKNFVLGAGQSALHGEEHPLEAGAITGALGGAAAIPEASALSRAWKGLPEKVPGHAADAMNRYIGLSKSDLPKWERNNIKDVREVGKTVLDNVGIKISLEEQHLAIDSARDSVQKQTEFMLQNTKGRLVPYAAELTQAHDKLLKEVIQSGQDIGEAQS